MFQTPAAPINTDLKHLFNTSAPLDDLPDGIHCTNATAWQGPAYGPDDCRQALGKLSIMVTRYGTTKFSFPTINARGGGYHDFKYAYSPLRAITSKPKIIPHRIGILIKRRRILHFDGCNGRGCR